MNSAKPPRLAAWILQEFGPDLNREVLAGDLNEAMAQGRSSAWYWRQVLAAIRWRGFIRPLLGSALMGWLLTSSMVKHEPILGRPIDMVVITATYFVSLFAPGMMRGRLRALVVLFVAASFGLLWRYHPDLADHYWIFFWVVASNFAFYWKGFAPPPYHLTWRELVYGDPGAEKQRLLEKLHLAMMQETDPEKRQAYAESIAALRSNDSPAAKATQ